MAFIANRATRYKSELRNLGFLFISKEDYELGSQVASKGFNWLMISLRNFLKVI